MKKILSLLLTIVMVFGFAVTAFAVPMKLYLESYAIDVLPQVSTIIDLVDPSDQVAIAEQAGLLALSSDGWNLATAGAFLEIRELPEWTGTFFILAAS